MTKTALYGVGFCMEKPVCKGISLLKKEVLYGVGYCMEKLVCKVISLLKKRLFMEGGGGLWNRFVEGICLIAVAPCGGNFLINQTLCKGIFLLKRVLYGGWFFMEPIC